MAHDVIKQIRAEAVEWHLRLRDGDGSEWDALTVWLEEDPAHATAFEAVAIADAELDPVLAQWPVPQPVAANDDEAASRWKWSGKTWAAGGAIATALVLAVVGGPRLLNDGRYEVITAPGEQRMVTLGEGSQIALNGGSRITLDKDDPRFASLASGEATFQIRHDAAAPFVLDVGGAKLQDIGTIFNVATERDGFSVEVAEGAVRYLSDSQSIALGAGQALRASGGKATVARKDPALIASWRNGRLHYRDASLATVAADLSRAIGVTVRVAPAMAARSFTGTIRVDRNQDRLFARIAALIDADVRRTADGWIISPRSRASD